MSEQTKEARQRALRSWAGRMSAEKRWGKEKRDTVKVRVYREDAKKLGEMGVTSADAVRGMLEEVERLRGKAGG